MGNYQEQWRRYRVRRRWIITCTIVEFIGFIPFVGEVSIASQRLFPGSDLGLPAAICWGALYLFTGSRLRSFPCPRCGKNFFGGILGDVRVLLQKPRAFLGRECVYCGLPIYSDT